VPPGGNLALLPFESSTAFYCFVQPYSAVTIA
jgi:hypothetical protein